MKRRPVVYLIAGSNGAGKTTFAIEYLPRYVGPVNFINADLIAQGLSPLNAQQSALAAGRLVLQRIEHLRHRKETFAIETTLAGRTYGTLLRRMKSEGYRIHIYYLWIPTADLALRRISTRVRQGGHNVDGAVVNRRFARTLTNFFGIYYELADSALILDNSGSAPKVIAEKRGRRKEIKDAELYERMLQESRGDEEG